jgi:hypothetical protein
MRKLLALQEQEPGDGARIGHWSAGRRVGDQRVQGLAGIGRT